MGRGLILQQFLGERIGPPLIFVGIRSVTICDRVAKADNRFIPLRRHDIHSLEEIPAHPSAIEIVSERLIADTVSFRKMIVAPRTRMARDICRHLAEMGGYRDQLQWIDFIVDRIRNDHVARRD